MNRYAKYQATLIDADEPILVLLTRQTGNGQSFFFASAMPDEYGELDYYFAVSVRPSIAKRYFRGQCDLRYIFKYSRGRKYYKIDKDEIISQRVRLTFFEGNVGEDHLPAPRLFSSSHTSEYGLVPEATGEETLFVDGEWEMPEFGDFYKRYSDVYLYLASMKRLFGSEAGDSEKKRIRQAILTKPFKGGSSYLSLFSDLRTAIPFGARPSLEKIRYASPGEMDIRGDEDVFKNLEKLIVVFLRKSGDIKSCHDELRSYMSQKGFLKVASRNPTLSATDAEFVATKSRELDALMETDGFDGLGSITQGNVIVTAKIVLALYRRLEFTSNFFAQGRVGYDAH